MSRLNYESIGYNFKFPAQRVLQIRTDQRLLFPFSIDVMNYLLVQKNLYFFESVSTGHSAHLAQKLRKFSAIRAITE